MENQSSTANEQTSYYNQKQISTKSVTGINNINNRLVGSLRPDIDLSVVGIIQSNEHPVARPPPPDAPPPPDHLDQ